MISDRTSTDAIRGEAATPALRVEQLSKTFPGTRALADASIEIRPGEVHALVGQNGSGKSTLIKTLAGYHLPDPGAVAELAGQPFALGHTVPDGLRFVHQDLGLVLELNAMDNLALRGDFIRGFAGRVRWNAQVKETHRILERFEVDLDIHRPLAEATPVQRTVVAIAGALQGWHGGGGVLVLDEPTAVLPHDEVERLLAMVREVQRSGTSVLYVSHRLDEIFEIADRVTILRAGRVVNTLPVADVDQRGLAQLMVGSAVDPDYRAPVAARPDSDVVLELRGVHGRRLHGLDLDVHRGEILGIAGLAGDGVNELPYLLAGHQRHPASGRIPLPQRASEWTDIADAAHLEIPLVPAESAVARSAHPSCFAFNRIGAVYVWLAIVVVFSVWVPDTFPTVSTVKQILNANAITALAALSITIPLAARVFDLSFAYTMTLTGVIAAHFLSVGVPLGPALLLAFGAGVVIGIVNAVVVVVMRIDSFIATLATGSIIQALITMATGGTAIISTKLEGGFSKIGQTNIGGLTLPVGYVLVVAIAMWFLLEHTATGRRLYATGFNADAAKLAGVRVNRLRFTSLVVSGTLAGASGLVLASTLGSGDPSGGTSYLLPAFAAAFLGATQLKHGRFNAFGTLIAVLLLGTGTTGLALANAPQWSADMFVGVVLIASLAATGIQRRATVGDAGRLRLLLARLRPSQG